MGKETACVASIDGRPARVKAHLDGTGLRVWGEVRFAVSAADVREVRADGEFLRFRAPAGDVALALGERPAKTWAKALATPKSLLEKLGVERSLRLCALDVADADFVRALRERVEMPLASALQGEFDTIFLWCDDAAALERLSAARRHLAAAGAVWIVAPKGKASPVPERVVRAAIAAAGLVDVKIAAFSATHTATKAVIPLAARATKAARAPAAARR